MSPTSTHVRSSGIVRLSIHDVMTPTKRPPIDHLPLEVQARIVALDAIAVYAASMRATADAIAFNNSHPHPQGVTP